MAKHLTPREIRILAQLANGDTYAEVRSYFGITFQNMHSTCYLIRKKAGIEETRDPAQCKRALARIPPQKVADALNPAYRTATKQVTPAQIDVFRLLAVGRTYPQIAAFLGTTAQSAQNLASRGAQRAGIIHAGWNRTRFIREWLARYDRERKDSHPPADPMDDPMF